MKLKEKRMALLSGRQKLAYDLRKRGLAFKSIGALLGVGAQRAAQLNRRAVWILSAEPEWYDGLSVRAANCLNFHQLTNRKEALEAYQSGKLHPSNRLIRNYGWTTHMEIAKWLGLPEPKKPAPRVRVRVDNVCPHCGGKLVGKKVKA